jgi:hypothetical protein
MEGAVKPWEWAAAPSFWLNAVLIAMKAENDAREHLNKKAERKSARSRGRKKRGI